MFLSQCNGFLLLCIHSDFMCVSIIDSISTRILIPLIEFIVTEFSDSSTALVFKLATPFIGFVIHQLLFP